MIKAVLLDLDDTLLAHPGDQFVSAYVERVAQHFGGGGGGMAQWIQSMRNPRQDYRLTNTQVALQAIAQDCGATTTELANEFAAFYRGAYPDLRKYTQPIDAAPVLLETLTTQGYAVVIATNPVFPAEAIRQRLEWASLPGDFDAYAFVTTSDNMHFIKPDAAYYAEILARVGVEPEEAVMVGNSPENDITPAQTMGMRTYHVLPAGAEPGANAGALAAYTDAVQRGWLDEYHPLQLTPEMVLAELRGNIGALFGLLAEVKPNQWTQHPDPQEWSILQVVCHLLERESSVQRPRLARILHEDNPFLTSPAAPTDPTESDDTDGLQVALSFAAQRHETLSFLAALPPAVWQRPARHSIFSDTTLLEMAHFAAQHDRIHITQICQTLGRCD